MRTCKRIRGSFRVVRVRPRQWDARRTRGGSPPLVTVGETAEVGACSTTTWQREARRCGAGGTKRVQRAESGVAAAWVHRPWSTLSTSIRRFGVRGRRALYRSPTVSPRGRGRRAPSVGALSPAGAAHRPRIPREDAPGRRRTRPRIHWSSRPFMRPLRRSSPVDAGVGRHQKPRSQPRAGRGGHVVRLASPARSVASPAGTPRRAARQSRAASVRLNNGRSRSRREIRNEP